MKTMSSLGSSLGLAPTHRLPSPITLDLIEIASQCRRRTKKVSRANNGRNNIASNDGSFLPLDVLSHILLRFPVKTLCRLRAVCRSWRSLLSDPLFIAEHGARSPGPHIAVCVDAGKRAGNRTDVNFIDLSGNVVKKIRISPLSSRSQEVTVQPHLDLVLIDGPPQVLNPATGAMSPLPMPEFRFHELDRQAPCDTFVLGRATSTNGDDDGKYKVLGFRMFTVFTECKVFTLGVDRAWRNAPLHRTVLDPSWNGMAICKGVAYYNVASSFYNDRTVWLIAAFNLEEEQWRQDLLKGPIPVLVMSSLDTIMHKSLATVNGRLAAVLNGYYSVDVWLLMDPGNSEQAVIWCKQCTVPTSSIRASPECRMRWGLPEPLWVMDDGRVVFRMYYAGDKVLRIYDPKSKTYKDLLTMPNYIKAGAGLYTGNLLRVEERGAEQPYNC